MERDRTSRTERVGLSADERQALATIERRLRREAPELHEALRRRRRVPWDRHGIATACVATAGTAVTTAGLTAGDVLVGFAGFVMTTVGAYGLTFHPTTARMARSAARTLGLAAREEEPPSPGGAAGGGTVRRW